MKALYDNLCQKVSQLTTNQYSTSFSLSSRLLSKKTRSAIYAIYGLVRLSDEIVDTFHDYDKKKLLEQLQSDYADAINMKISLNPILHSFQIVYHQYNFEPYLVEKFFESMARDLKTTEYNVKLYNQYIHGSAEVVGLMCLKVFVNGDEAIYSKLKHSAMKLGSAFQKVNFLRDIEYDNNQLGRMYFPNIDIKKITNLQKNEIISDIESDFDDAIIGLRQLNRDSFFGVYIAYFFYKELLYKIKKANITQLHKQRIRISNFRKIIILINCAIKRTFGIL